MIGPGTDVDAAEPRSSRADLLYGVSFTYAVAFAGLLASAVVHEGLHAALHLLLGGELRPCGLGPFGISGGRLQTCYATPGSPVNALLTPVVVSAFGLVAMLVAPRLDPPPVRWGAFAGGCYVWGAQALYSMGSFVPPTVTDEGVYYTGDGVEALEAFGLVAVLPGALLLTLGSFVLVARMVDGERL